MAKRINLKIILVFSCVFLFSSFAEAQIWREITPLESTRQDVIRIQKGEKQLPNGDSFFDLEEDTVTIKYYSGGCSKSEEKAFNLFSGIVTEMKGVPKVELPLAVLSIGSDDNGDQKIKLSDIKNMYVDFNSGFVVITETPKNKPELAVQLFYIPKKAKKLPQCLLKKMDPIVQKLFELNSKTK